jgi:hypothetical protein
MKKKLLKADLKARIDNIIEIGKYDDESAHCSEDDLHRELIEEFCPEWVVKEIDRLSKADFARWCA